MFAIAIDGPAGAGKSSVAKAVAMELGFTYVDTGALYRSLALYMLEQGVELQEPDKVIARLPEADISLEYGPGGQRTLLNGRDVSEAIREERVSNATSKWIAHVPKVREFLLGLQRRLAERSDVVMDGRDIGTVVLPGAQLKVFLTASPEERARRRALQLAEAGTPEPYEAILDKVNRRDRQDAEQLDVMPPDVVLLDTTGLSFAQVVEKLTEMARERM